MSQNIEAVLLFLADRTGQNRFAKREGAGIQVNPPSRWLEESDESLGLSGALLNWIDEKGMIQRFEQFKNGDEFRASVQTEFPGKDLKYRHCQTDSLGYNLVVVFGSQAPAKTDAPPIDKALEMELRAALSSRHRT